MNMIEETRASIEQQINYARLRANSSPQLLETAYASADIFQMHLARSQAKNCPPDILIEPDMRDALPTAFDRADEFIEEGRRAILEKSSQIEALLA